MARTNFAELSVDGLAKAGALAGIVWWIVGLAWHGALQQPSILNQLYGKPYLDPALQVIALVGLAVMGYVTGWLFAYFYNWAIKR